MTPKSCNRGCGDPARPSAPRVVTLVSVPTGPCQESAAPAVGVLSAEGPVACGGQGARGARGLRCGQGEPRPAPGRARPAPRPGPSPPRSPPGPATGPPALSSYRQLLFFCAEA